MSPTSKVSPSSAFLLPELAALGDAVCHVLQLGVEDEVLGDAVLVRVQPLIAQGRVTSGDVVRLALLVDALRLAETAMSANGSISDSEVEYVIPLLEAAAKRLSTFREYYGALREPTLEQAREFLDMHRPDPQLFGGACAKSRWLGLEIVKRVAEETSDRAPLEQYSELMLRLSEEIIAIDGASASAERLRMELEQRLGLRRLLEQAQGSTVTDEDPRIRAFCSPEAPEVFHAIAHANQIWKRDPLDVECLHREVRDLFSRLVERAGEQSEAGTGRVLLVLGEAGSGKTHLMRAFRERVHGGRSGYVGYMQLSAAPEDYGRYVLINVIESLEKPYDEPAVMDSGLMCLSDALLMAPVSIAPEMRHRLRENEMSDDELCTLVFELADEVVCDPRFRDVDIDLVRALLFLQRREPPLYARVLKYLRGEPLGRRDLAMLGDLTPRTASDDALRSLVNLGKLIARTDGGALVVLLDQLEDIHNREDRRDRFVRLMDVVRHLVDNVPNALIVASTLRDFYQEMRAFSTRAVLDRLEHEPEPQNLLVGRSLVELEALVERRLAHLYESQGVRHRPDDALFPYPRAFLERLTGLSARDAFHELHLYQTRCMAAGRIVGGQAEPVRPPTVTPPPPELDALWLTHHETERDKVEVPDSDEELLELLRGALSAVRFELPDDLLVAVEKTSGGLLVTGPQSTGALVHVTNRSSRGGGLGGQINQLLEAARQVQRCPVAVRSSDFGGTGASALAKSLANLVKAPGRRVVVENAEWRMLLTYRSFLAKHREDDGFDTFARATRPLLGLKVVQAILDVDAVRITALATDKFGSAITSESKLASSPQPASVRTSSPPQLPEVLTTTPPDNDPPPRLTGPLRLGRTISLQAKPAELDPQLLKRHGAFLGAPGSGKTSLALNVIEQLALRGVGAILLDRKGDLASYADPTWWRAVDGDPAREASKRVLRERARVRLFTPGNPTGRSLRIRAVPEGLANLPPHERSQIAQFAAQGLGAMMGYKGTATELTNLAILAKSIEVLSQLSAGREVALKQLIALLAEEDESLIAEIGHLDPKLFKKLVTHLETLRLNHGGLLESKDDPLRAEVLLGRDGSVPAGRVPFTIISTKFLGDAERVDFWVSQLLVELSRWCSRSPAPHLQSVLFLDEADIYLPATSKPATKEPLLDLLKRARSAGLGVLLATQNPGDLDYKARDNITTWWLGKIGSRTAIEKMRPLLSECRTDVSGSLATASVGEFFQVSDGQVVRMRSDRALMDTVQLAEEAVLKLAALP